MKNILTKLNALRLGLSYEEEQRRKLEQQGAQLTDKYNALLEEKLANMQEIYAKYCELWKLLGEETPTFETWLIQDTKNDLENLLALYRSKLA